MDIHQHSHSFPSINATLHCPVPFVVKKKPTDWLQARWPLRDPPINHWGVIDSLSYSHIVIERWQPAKDKLLCPKCFQSQRCKKTFAVNDQSIFDNWVPAERTQAYKCEKTVTCQFDQQGASIKKSVTFTNLTKPLHINPLNFNSMHFKIRNEVINKLK